MSLKVVEAIKIDDTHFETKEKIDDNINEVLIKFRKNVPNKQKLSKEDLLKISVWSEEDIQNIKEVFQNDIDHLKIAETSLDFWNNDVDDEVWNNV
jgi:hypothetical protein